MASRSRKNKTIAPGMRLWQDLQRQFKRGLLYLLLFAGLASHMRYHDVHWDLTNRLPASPLWQVVSETWPHRDSTADHSLPVSEEVTNVWQLMEKGEPEEPVIRENPPANVFSKLGFHSAGTSKAGGSKRSRVDQKREAYVKKYAELARKEQDKYGIPASITLAQGILESLSGESRLARENNNHFGIKCFSRRCAKGHCSNFEDDHHKDFFRKYDSVWESYRAHSQLLRGKRYRHLLQLDAKDYKGWAYGLKKAGYATDKRYAEKLIRLIEELDLHRYDR